MQLEVHNQKLEKLLNDPNKMIRKIGLGKPHLLTGNLDGYF